MTTNTKDKMKEVAMEIGQAETYRALICPTCKGGKTLLKKVQGKGCYEVVLDICDRCHGTGEIEVTNEEYIRSCSTEELPKALKEMFFDIKSRVRSELGGYNELMKSERYFYEWLKEKHE